MSDIFDKRRGRAGLLACACDIDPPDDTIPSGEAPTLALFAAGFGFSIVAQVLAFAVLPLAGAVLAPSPAASTAPFVLMLAGAALATFPASFLPGRFGRRSAFALGASLGVAGAAIGAWGIAAGQFAGLCLGAFWLGTAQGFGLFYRHAAATKTPSGARAIAIVMGAASVAAVAAPAVIRVAQDLAGPLAPAAALIGAGLAQICVLTLAGALPAGIEVLDVEQSWSGKTGLFVAISAAVALAWLGMTLLMVSAPLLMAGCGLGLGAASSAISWHVLAMYAPAAAIGVGGRRLPETQTVFAGLALLIMGGVASRFQTTAAGFDVALIIGGCGWSLATLAATLWIHRQGVPPRSLLAVHDFGLFAGAICGALLAGLLA
ncbi:MAG TPA: hypothetical protein VLZ74_09170 [Methylocella sp.]|nr:hypothetical protein [Methylocella sp.]